MTEYLVELAQGREAVYRTPLELRAAMRSGEITPDARIFHRAASRWISIAEHPEYRRFLAERRPPDWLEPIPFEPAPPEYEPLATPRGLAGLWRKARQWLRGRRASAKPASPPGPSVAVDPPSQAPRVRRSRPRPVKPERPAERRIPAAPPDPAPDAEVTDYAPPDERRWTFY